MSSTLTQPFTGHRGANRGTGRGRSNNVHRKTNYRKNGDFEPTSVSADAVTSSVASNIDLDTELGRKVKELIDLTRCSPDLAAISLHDTDSIEEAAAVILEQMEGARSSGDVKDEWMVNTKKKKSAASVSSTTTASPKCVEPLVSEQQLFKSSGSGKRHDRRPGGSARRQKNGGSLRDNQDGSEDVVGEDMPPRFSRGGRSGGKQSSRGFGRGSLSRGRGRGGPHSGPRHRSHSPTSWDKEIDSWNGEAKEFTNSQYLPDGRKKPTNKSFTGKADRGDRDNFRSNNGGLNSSAEESWEPHQRPDRPRSNNSTAGRGSNSDSPVPQHLHSNSDSSSYVSSLAAYKHKATEELKSSLRIGGSSSPPMAFTTNSKPPRSKPPPPSKIPNNPVEMVLHSQVKSGSLGVQFGNFSPPVTPPKEPTVIAPPAPVVVASPPQPVAKLQPPVSQLPAVIMPPSAAVSSTTAAPVATIQPTSLLQQQQHLNSSSTMSSSSQTTPGKYPMMANNPPLYAGRDTTPSSLTQPSYNTRPNQQQSFNHLYDTDAFNTRSSTVTGSMNSNNSSISSASVASIPRPPPGLQQPQPQQQATVAPNQFTNYNVGYQTAPAQQGPQHQEWNQETIAYFNSLLQLQRVYLQHMDYDKQQQLVHQQLPTSSAPATGRSDKSVVSEPNQAGYPAANYFNPTFFNNYQQPPPMFLPTPVANKASVNSSAFGYGGSFDSPQQQPGQLDSMKSKGASPPHTTYQKTPGHNSSVTSTGGYYSGPGGNYMMPPHPLMQQATQPPQDNKSNKPVVGKPYNPPGNWQNPY